MTGNEIRADRASAALREYRAAKREPLENSSTPAT
jgi:hypothetical protein